MNEPYERLAYWLGLHLYTSSKLAEVVGCSAKVLREKLKGRSPLLVSDLLIIAQKTRMTNEQLTWILRGDEK